MQRAVQALGSDNQEAMQLKGAIDLVDWIVSGKMEGYAVHTLGLNQDEETSLPEEYMSHDSTQGIDDG